LSYLVANATKNAVPCIKRIAMHNMFKSQTDKQA
jgi:hypothetical protein